MSYALFLIAPAPGSKEIPIKPWKEFVNKIDNFQLKGENSQLLAKGVWQLSLNEDSPRLHELIIAATEARLQFRYVITSDQLSWIYSS